MQKSKIQKFKNGGVSMFLVIAACLMVSIIVASFVRLMIRDQQQAINQDLSQSAYDSAQTGVEDAKRFYQKYVQDCQNGANAPTGSDCEKMKASFDKTTMDSTKGCYTLSTAGIAENGKETPIQSSKGSNGKNNLDQSYTCVKIYKETSDFAGKLNENGSRIIPLKGVTDFNKVRISWFSEQDKSGKTLELPNVTELPAHEKWQSDNTKITPSLMRMQFFRYAPGTDLAALDGNFTNSATGANTLFGYPSSVGSTSLDLLAKDNRRNGSAAPNAIKCQPNDSTNAFYCSVDVQVGTVLPTDSAFLRLTAYYNSADFEVRLFKGNDSVLFDGVQPKVDSTGRANSLFRRVESRLEFADPNVPLPDFAAAGTDESAANGLCKDFWVTNITNGGECW
jgi:hypothetical protein